MKEKYESLINKIKKFEADLEADKSLSKVKEIYFGIQVLYSPLIINPTFLFIGINPGIGYHKQNDQKVRRFNALKYFEYGHYNYLLARETRKVFDNAKLLHELENSVKTNCYFFSTKTQADLYRFMSHLKLEYDVYNHSANWVKELIEIINPSIIICEGKSAFERITRTKCDGPIVGALSGIYNDIPVIGYSRNRSFINEKDSVSKLIKETYDKLSVTYSERKMEKIPYESWRVS